jgi:polyisoprenyl-teichoic acid--peptidoglycan teichoic acid transferase
VRGRGRRTWGQRLVLATCSALVVGLLGAAGALGYTYSKYSRLARVELGSVLAEEVASDEPQNLLLVGIDSAANLDPDDPVSAGRDAALRSDTMMVLRVDPGTEQAHLLSIPRDLWVPLASGGNQRINTAIQIGGAPELIDTIEGYLGIPIHHYAQVDFAAFRELVEVVGGVEVWFDHPTRDRQAGLSVPDPGCVLLDPDQALAYVRARHLQTLVDGRWRTDPTGDLGRMSRQQDFIVRAVRRAISRGARNPVTLDRLIDAALAAVTVDDQWRAEDMAALAGRFRLFDPDRLIRHALPVADASIGGAAVLRLVDDEARPTLDLFRGVDPAQLAPADVRVEVLNGTGRTGHAGEIGDALEAVGFTTVGVGEAERFGFDQTVVRYVAGSEAAADLVARHLDPTAVLELVDGALGADVVVVTGLDLQGVIDEPAPSTTPTTPTTQVPGSTSSTAATPTTTTVIGEVPTPPEGVSC